MGPMLIIWMVNGLFTFCCLLRLFIGAFLCVRLIPLSWGIQTPPLPLFCRRRALLPPLHWTGDTTIFSNIIPISRFMNSFCRIICNRNSEHSRYYNFREKCSSKITIWICCIQRAVAYVRVQVHPGGVADGVGLHEALQIGVVEPGPVVINFRQMIVPPGRVQVGVAQGLAFRGRP